MRYPPDSLSTGTMFKKNDATRSRPPVLALRGGLASVSSIFTPATIDAKFNIVFSALVFMTTSLFITTRERRSDAVQPTPKAAKMLQCRFLLVFWLYKMADWLQGPYFYEVYASKVINGVAVSSAGVARLFLTGFGSTAIFGAIVGGLVDTLGRKRGSLMFALMYSLSALSTRCGSLGPLFAGRVAGGIGTSLLFSAPEAWLVSEHQRSKLGEGFLGQTFGMAYLGDAIVAIIAGQLAGIAATRAGPTAPFELSVVFLVAGAAVIAALWKENYGGMQSALSDNQTPNGSGSTAGIVKDAFKAMLVDRRIMLVGAVQALFEGAMYIFVLQWPPAIKAALGSGVSVPFGKIFSCFMVCCMLGSTTFAKISRSTSKLWAEDLMLVMLVLATAAMASATMVGLGGSLVPLVGAFFAFEACVGMYFPLIGTLRSRYLPDAYRGVIMNLFSIPLNLIVVAVFLSISKLGLSGAFVCSTTALAGAAVAMFGLRSAVR